MTVRRHGSWSSPIRAADVAAASRRLSQPRLDRGALHWLEGRPSEGGRQLVMAWRPGGTPEERSPAQRNVRSRVHEYGGGDYAVDAGRIAWVRFDDQQIEWVEGPGAAPRPLTRSGARHADLVFSPDGRWLVAVEERHAEGREPENRLLAIPLGGGVPRPFGEGFDFVSSPCFAPDGSRLAFLGWHHPNMPWDGTELLEVDWGAQGPGATRRRAGGDRESIFQPRYSPAGRLTFASDRSGWWNLEQLGPEGRVALHPDEAEFGRPQWAFGMSTWDFVSEDVLLCACGRGGCWSLGLLDRRSGVRRELDLPYDSFLGVSVEGSRAALLAAGTTQQAAIGLLDLESGTFETVRRDSEIALAPAVISRPEVVHFETDDGETAHAFLYRPKHPTFEAPAGERPPLVVKCHGGPTGAATTALDARIQFWTSRGFAVIDVDYRGSSGYGRAYREKLAGRWGVADVADCAHAARFAAEAGLADPERLAISGGSAGGFTVLCALTFRDVFGAGASHYGIGDLESLARDTHKFESRYLDGLVGPWPAERARYRARSPLHHAERIDCPVIFFQGLEDRVVPPAQAEAMVAALARRGVPHAYVSFPGEQHGFRRAENVSRALETELAFYGRVFGFDGGAPPAGVEFVGL